MNRRHFMQWSAAATLAAGATRVAQAQSKTYRVAVIGDTKNGGYGHSLHRVWAPRKEVDVVALADPDPEGRAQNAKECGAENTYADYREMLAKEKPDIVTIGPRTTDRHLEYLLACAEVGAHGMLEKPLTPDLAQGDEAIAALDAKNLKWVIAFNYRASPMNQHARKALIEDRVIGEILEVRMRGKQDGRAGGEDLIVLGIHLFDLLRFFLGDPQWCFADITMDGKPAKPSDVREATEALGPIVGNGITATYGLPNGVTAHFLSRKNSGQPGGAWGIDFYGTEGIVTVRMKPVPEVYLWRTTTWATDPGQPVNWEPLPGAPNVPLRPGEGNIYDEIVDDLLRAIAEDRKPDVSIHHGLAATEMIQAVWESHIQGKRVTLPLKKRDHPLTRWS